MSNGLPDSGFKAVIDGITEQRRWAKFWNDQARRVRDLILDGDGDEDELVGEESLRKLILLTQPQNIGHGPNQIRPSKLGQWDVYYSLLDQMSKISASILSGLPLDVIDRHMALENAGVDPDNTDEVREFDRIQQMTSEEVEGELERLESLLAD